MLLKPRPHLRNLRGGEGGTEQCPVGLSGHVAAPRHDGAEGGALCKEMETGEGRAEAHKCGKGSGRPK